MIMNLKYTFCALCMGVGLMSCNDYLDREPMSYVVPESYFTDASQLEAYVNGLYTSILPSHGNWSYGIYGDDTHTDNQASQSYDNKYAKGQWKTSNNNDNWSFSNINSINYFFEVVLPKVEANEVNGDQSSISHYIGEMYFLRAYDYFYRLKKFGDYPILTTTQPDDLAVLTEASKRSPRNEVARFILSDLDKAVEYLSVKDMETTRINKNAALLLKSRVSLFEGSWLKNFTGTAFVPGGEGWPGAQKDYQSGFSYEAGSIEDEYRWFFQQSMDAAKQVADAVPLTQNTGIVPQDGSDIAKIDAQNPYLAIFGTEELSSYPEVLLWRQYSKSLGVTHCVVVAAQHGDYGIGVTRGMVDGFLMQNGLPIYAQGSGYQGDQTIADVRTGRDPRLFVFLKEPGQKNILIENADGSHAVPVEPYPDLISTSSESGYSTGYALRKGSSFDQGQCGNGSCYTACPVMRAAEAYLNYIEADYELNGTLNATSRQYWTAIRARHEGMDTDFQKTIDATDMTEEAKNDWGAYTAGTVIDATRYNIRRERRCEYMAEGLRWMDLIRWRALDQMTTTPYRIEGMHIWNTPMQSWYDAEALAASVSPASRGEYIHPYETASSSLVYDGYTWAMAQYLDPLPIKQFLLTSEDGSNISTSPLYQNPYWPTSPDEPAEK